MGGREGTIQEEDYDESEIYKTVSEMTRLNSEHTEFLKNEGDGLKFFSLQAT